MTNKYIAMIPARLGSQRLRQKNLALLDGRPLITHAIEKCRAAGCFDEVWVTTEADEIGAVAVQAGAKYHRRPPELANNVATSEDFIADFLENHPCDAVFQVHSIAPLLTTGDVREFVTAYEAGTDDVLLSCIEDRIEVAYQGMPVNFTFDEKTNSQDLLPTQRITWAITAWRRRIFLNAIAAGRTATYAGQIGMHPVNPMAGHVIKTQLDLDIAASLLPLIHEERAAA